MREEQQRFENRNSRRIKRKRSRYSMARETIIFVPLILSLRDNRRIFSPCEENLAIKTFPSSLRMDREEDTEKLDRICRWSKEKVETKQVYGIIVVELSETFQIEFVAASTYRVVGSFLNFDIENKYENPKKMKLNRIPVINGIRRSRNLFM